MPTLTSPNRARACRAMIATAMVLALPACAGSYTGPVEVTRFVAEQRSALGNGTITIELPDEIANLRARNAIVAAVADELSGLGYSVILDGSSSAEQVALVTSSRNPLAAASSRGPVSVGAGGSTGSYGSGVGVGIGINLGGGNRGPNVVSELAVRISSAEGDSLWEGRAQQAVSMKSPYSDVEASARTLAAALFKDFPGGNGETVTVDVSELQGPE